MFNLRPYQEEAVAAVLNAWSSFDRVLTVLPTGTGKTVIFSSLIQSLVESGGRILVLAHRDELLRQAQDKLYRSTGYDSEIEKANEKAWRSAAIVIGSVQTLQGARLESWDSDHFDFIIVDEAHHCLADSYQNILNHFTAKVLGVTATPDRGDKKCLGKYFQTIAYEYGLVKAIEEGYLAPIQCKTIPLSIDLNSVGTTAGDYSTKDIGNALTPYLDAIADSIKVECEGRKTLIFMPLVQTSTDLVTRLWARGVRAAHVDGYMDRETRKGILHGFESGDSDVLLNSLLLTEGYDCPAIDCVIVLRPTKVRSLFCQMVGRATRLAPGKTECLILDYLWLHQKHDLCSAVSLVAGSQRTVQLAKAIDRVKGGSHDLLELAEEAEDLHQAEVRHERENALAKQLAQQKGKKSKTVNPLRYALAVDARQLLDYQPVMVHEMRPPTQKQLDLLKRFGFDAGDVPSQGYASKLIDVFMNRQRNGLASPKMVTKLKSYYKDLPCELWSFEKAQSVLGRIAKNRWRPLPVREVV